MNSRSFIMKKCLNVIEPATAQRVTLKSQAIGIVIRIVRSTSAWPTTVKLQSPKLQGVTTAT